MKKIPLSRLVRILRSKNAGPFQLALDIVFKNDQIREAITRRKAINKRAVAHCFGVSQSKILAIEEDAATNTIKIVILRETVAGAPGDADVYGAQQHAPLLEMPIEIPGELLGEARSGNRVSLHPMGGLRGSRKAVARAKPLATITSA